MITLIQTAWIFYISIADSFYIFVQGIAIALKCGATKAQFDSTVRQFVLSQIRVDKKIDDYNIKFCPPIVQID